MAYFICEKQGRCCPHEFYDSIERAIDDSEDGVPCDHLIEVSPVRYGRWVKIDTTGLCGDPVWNCSSCGYPAGVSVAGRDYCPNCGAKMDLEDIP